jgi:hypothetical protein
VAKHSDWLKLVRMSRVIAWFEVIAWGAPVDAFVPRVLGTLSDLVIKNIFDQSPACLAGRRARMLTWTNEGEIFG